MEEETKATQVRFPASMYNRLTEMAKKSRRSLNAEIIVCLEDFFKKIDAPKTSADEPDWNEMMAFLKVKAAEQKATKSPPLLPAHKRKKPENPRPPAAEPPQGSA